MSIKTLILLATIVILGGLLRFFALSTNPPGLYVDEIAIGENAYAILTTGKDQYGYSYPFAFKSFGDYKMPVYIYMVSGSMALFGKTEFAVRFPSAFFGTLTIILIFFITKEFLSNEKKLLDTDGIPLLAALIFAILPWHIHFSRGGFEVTLALFFYCLGLVFYLRYIRKFSIPDALGMIVFSVLAMYTYHSFRIRVPLTFGVYIGYMLYLYGRSCMKQVAFIVGVFLLVSFPLILYSFSPEGQERMMQTSAFLSQPVTHGITGLVTDSTIFIHNYLSFFSLTYLFHLGDQNTRHQIPNFGLLYLWQLPVIIYGFYYLKQTKKKKLRHLLLALLIIGPIPASLAVPSPHTLRYLVGTLPFTILTALGIYQIYLQKKQWSYWAIRLVIVLAFIEGLYFLNYYFIHYPKESAYDWGGKCKEIATKIQAIPSKDYVVIDKNLLCIPEYFSFYVPERSLVYATPSWRKPEKWKNSSVIYIRPYYGQRNPEHLLYNIYLPNVNHDIFAQVFRL